MPAYLPTLVNLTSLSLPMPLVAGLGPGRVGPGLRTLVVGSEYDDPAPAAPLDGAAALPGLRGLLLVNAPPRLPKIIDPLPPLEYLRTHVDGDRAVLRQLRNLPTLRHLELAHLKNVDVFDSIVAPLQALEINWTGSRFPIAGLSALATLQALRLNSVAAEIDCAVFGTLPELLELTVLNSRRIVNVEALLGCPKLESIWLVNCGNPFGEDAKALFGTGRFARLDIDHA